MPRRAQPHKTVENKASHGRGSGASHPIDIHVGARIRTRRLLIGMNQEALATRLGITFQQVQKYEGGANRISASRLAAIAEILRVPVSDFFSGIADRDPEKLRALAPLETPEALELIRYFYGIKTEQLRDAFLSLVQTAAASQNDVAACAASTSGAASGD